jgi:hypothetical protein
VPLREVYTKSTDIVFWEVILGSKDLKSIFEEMEVKNMVLWRACNLT